MPGMSRSTRVLYIMVWFFSVLIHPQATACIRVEISTVGGPILTLEAGDVAEMLQKAKIE